MTGDTSKPGASRRRALLHFETVDDLRAIATPPFEPALRPVPAGVLSPYGDAAPFGSPAFAAHDAAGITSRATASVREKIPGELAAGSLWEGERFSLRIPHAWNGRLVVAGTPGQRTEFACDRIFADPLLARGYAYVCGNKGNGDGIALLEGGARLTIGGVAVPRFPLPGGRSIAFWQLGRGHRIERWAGETIELAALAREALRERRGREPEFTYAIGLSNGGYQVRRAVESCDVFDGALVWNAVLWSRDHNLLHSLSQAVRALAAGAPERIEDAGFPPDLHARSGHGSLYRRNAATYWYVTLWLHAMHLDPVASIAYGNCDDPGVAESWCGRMAEWSGDSSRIAERIGGFANTGAIRCKAIDVCSEYDHLVPPAVHFTPYGALVAAAGKAASYRARTIPGATHVDAWAPDPEYPALRPGHGDVLAAWDELVAWVESEPVKSG